MGRRTHYTFAARVLLCDSCGAPLQAHAEGGTFTCAYCHAVNQLEARVSLPTFAPAGATALGEPERIAGLRAQLSRPPAPPASLAPLLDKGTVPQWRTDEAFAVWQSSKRRAAQGDLTAGEELLFLSTQLSRKRDGEADVLRQRAMLESALEVLTLPRHRQVLAAALSRGAAREGDVSEAERWLQLCDPSAEALSADSAYRIARALVETMHKRYPEVRAVLGNASSEVPMLVEWRPLASLLRANALAHEGHMDHAVHPLLGTRSEREANAALAERHAAVGIHPELLSAVESAHRERGQARQRKHDAKWRKKRDGQRRLRRSDRVRNTVILLVALPVTVAAWISVAWFLPDAVFRGDPRGWKTANDAGYLAMISFFVGTIGALATIRTIWSLFSKRR